MGSRKSWASPRTVRLVSALVSATGYAAWVAFCARQLPWQAIVQSAGAQWLLSFVATFAFSACISRGVGASQRPAVALRVAGAAMLVYAGLLFGVHLYIGTPHPLLTLLPVLTLAGAYAVLFARLQVRHNCQASLA